MQQGGVDGRVDSADVHRTALHGRREKVSRSILTACGRAALDFSVTRAR